MRKHLAKMVALTFLLTTFLLPFAADAEEQTQERSESGGPDAVQFVMGYVDSPFLVEPSRTSLDYVQANVRFIWGALPEFVETHDLPGTIDLIAEITNSFITEGAGNYMGGVTGIIRYNFKKPEAQWIPYIQLGAGVIYNDVYKDYSQGLIGQAVEFSFLTSIGLRYRVDSHWSIDVEGMFQHISNFGMDERNVGVNAGGVFLGTTYHF